MNNMKINFWNLAQKKISVKIPFGQKTTQPTCYFWHIDMYAIYNPNITKSFNTTFMIPYTERKRTKTRTPLKRKLNFHLRDVIGFLI